MKTKRKKNKQTDKTEQSEQTVRFYRCVPIWNHINVTTIPNSENFVFTGRVVSILNTRHLVHLAPEKSECAVYWCIAQITIEFYIHKLRFALFYYPEFEITNRMTWLHIYFPWLSTIIVKPKAITLYICQKICIFNPVLIFTASYN